MVFMTRQRVKDLLLQARIVVRTSNVKISRRRLADYIKALHQKACHTCSTNFFLHSINQIIYLWCCRGRCRRQISNSLMSQCANNNELALQHGGFCTMWSLAVKGLLENLLGWSLFAFIYNRSTIWISYISHNNEYLWNLRSSYIFSSRKRNDQHVYLYRDILLLGSNHFLMFI